MNADSFGDPLPPTRWCRPRLLAAVLAVLLVTSVGPVRIAAQATGTVTGRVTNATTQAPISSAQIFIVGLEIGSLTRNDGRFLIPNVPAGTHQVQARLIGFGTASGTVVVQAGQTSQIDLELRNEAISLDEVVVTGVGAASRRREIGNALEQIQMRDVEMKPIQNLENLLRANTTGVSGLAVSGQVGSSGTIMLRGVNSVSQGNEPLIYVDGIRLATSRIPPANLEDGRGPRVSGMSLNELNLGDIERVEMIKGAAATTLYGTEASGGVIQIFTKRGVPGGAQWSMTTSQGVNFWPTLSETIRSHETWLGLKQVQREGWLQRYDGSVRGGNEAMQFFLSANRGDEDGIVDTQGSKNWGATGNFTVELREGLTVQWNNTYTNRWTRYVPDSNNRHGYLLNAMRLDKGYYPGNLDPSWVLETELVGETDNFVSGVHVQHVRGAFRNSLRFGLHHLEALNSGLLPFGYYLYEPGSIGVQGWRNRTLSAEYTGTWEHNFTQALRSTFTVGGQLFDEGKRQVNASGLDFSGPGRVTVNSAAKTFGSETNIREVNAGGFLQETVGIQDRLFLIAGLRIDGSSTFGGDYGLQYYPKLSASWVVSDYDFLPAGWFNTLRVRAAVGEAGKAPSAFDAVRTWDPVAGLNAQPGITPQNLGNPDLGPERTREFEVGFDAGLLNSRLGVEMTYYNATTYDALFPVLPIPSMGFSRAQVQNVGQLSSKGLELSVDLAVLQSEMLSWSVGTNLTTNESRVEDMGTAAPISLGYNQEVRQGDEPPSFYGRKVLNPDAFADPIFEPSTYLGRTMPTLTLGMNTTVDLGRMVTLSALGELSQGGHILNSTAYLNTVRNIWPACVPIQQQAATEGVQRLTAAERAKCIRKFNGADQFIESGDFFKLRDVSAAIRIPDRFLPARVGTASFAITGSNLLTITDFTGMDPEVIDAGSTGTETFRRVDYYNFPPRRAIITKLSVSF